MANLVRRMFSSSSSLDSKRIVQSKEEHIQCNFNDWTIPEEQIETIYRVGTFDFKTAFSVKTHEETMNIQEKFQTIPLLSKVSLSKYFEKGFRYIHYGLIQVAVKPLVHIGVDAPVYLALRDKRLKRYKPSLLAMIQTNICNGPIYFNCAPNYSVSLTDPLILNSLVLDIHMQDEFQIENPHPPRDIERNEISQIIEEPDGNVLIRFNSMREQRPSSKFSIPMEPSRHSFVEPSRCSFAEKSENSFSMPTPIHVHHKAPIPEVSISPPLSPTASQMKGEIDVIHKNLEIDLDSLENDILDPENEEKRKWYFQSDPVYQERIKQEWINDINRLNIPFDFFCWFEYFTIKLGIEEDPFKISYINVQTSLAKKWKLNDGSLITQIHPPLQTIRLDTPDGEIIASPFKKGKDNDDSIKMDDIKKIYHQNNYSNQILHTIAKQVDSLFSDIKSIPRTNMSRFPKSHSSPHF
ncbi:hypothetical protein M9H77_07463 [Catharanthus roseus]|uniref:Uncharacterized protein n=1 Tax=Catharanthus roseus TaxID=4058 RepID=A0ACC0BVD8_CATRO|nr:hypothetical protein M9H77_07463 [Catharanthus roseus]